MTSILERFVTIGIVCLVGMLPACGDPQLAGYHLGYGIVGGKPSAPEERLIIDCRSLSIQFIRHDSFQLAQSTSEMRSLSIQQCQEVETVIKRAQLCNKKVPDNLPEKLVDGNTYTVTCYHSHSNINHQWYGTQPPFINWHKYTRDLIDIHFPQSYRYP